MSKFTISILTILFLFTQAFTHASDAETRYISRHKSLYPLCWGILERLHEKHPRATFQEMINQSKLKYSVWDTKTSQLTIPFEVIVLKNGSIYHPYLASLLDIVETYANESAPALELEYGTIRGYYIAREYTEKIIGPHKVQVASDIPNTLTCRTSIVFAGTMTLPIEDCQRISLWLQEQSDL